MKLPENPDAEGQPSASSTVSPPEELTLILVRHGETEYNAAGRIQGHRDIPLSSAGRDQAQRLAQRLARLWKPDDNKALSPFPVPDAIFTSDLSRASETASILKDGVTALQPLPFLSTPLLRERSYGDWQGMTMDELHVARAAQQHVDAPPGGETWAQVAERMDLAFEFLWQKVPRISETRTALVTGHGGSLRLFLIRALEMDADAAHVFRLGNTSLSVLQFRGTSAKNSKGRIVRVNDTAHLEG